MSTPEEPRPNLYAAARPETLADVGNFYAAADFAIDAVYDMQDHKAFATMLESRDIPFDDVRPEYWSALAEFSRKYCDVNVKKGLIDKRQACVINLAAASADFFAHQSKLNKDQSDLKKLSEFNGLVRDIANEYPHLPIREIIRLINQSAGMMDKRDGLIDTYATSVVLGVQHEIGFEQLLKTAGLDFDRSSTDEDLKGVDYYVVTDYRKLPIDVKASLYEVTDHNGGYNDQPCAWHNGKLVIYSMLTKADFIDDSFTVEPDALSER